MKLLKLSLLIFCFTLFNQNLSAHEKNDAEEIKKAALDYIEGYFYKDAKRMERALHPELVKRSIQKSKDGREFVLNLGATYMIMRTANNDNRHAKNPEKPIKAVVEIFDFTANAASVKVTTNQYRFFDYLHLGKFKNEWKIINVFWAHTPKEKK